MSGTKQNIKKNNPITQYRFDKLHVAVLDLRRLVYQQNLQIKQLASIMSRLVPMDDRDALKTVQKELDHYEGEYLDGKEIDDL